MVKQETKKNGVVEFETVTACALWECEIKGQLSDGAWENSRPWEHWKFWNGLDATLGNTNSVIRPPSHARCCKNSYNLAKLIEYVGNRMIAQARMALITDKRSAWKGADYMPATFKEFEESKRTSKWQFDFVGRGHMKSVSLAIARSFYADAIGQYGMKELRKDLKRIKAAMKTANVTSCW